MEYKPSACAFPCPTAATIAPDGPTTNTCRSKHPAANGLLSPAYPPPLAAGREREPNGLGFVGRSLPATLPPTRGRR